MTTSLTSLASVKAFLGLTGKPISGITVGNPTVITCAGHALTQGQAVGISGVTGDAPALALNAASRTATIVDANTFSVAVNTTASTSYGYAGALVGTDDPLLTDMIQQGSAWIENYCERTFAPTSYTMTKSGTNGTAMFFTERPVTAVSSVTIDGVAVPLSPEPTAPGYAFDEMQLVLRSRRFTRGMLNVVVAYTAGLASVPSDLQLAANKVVAWLFKQRTHTGKTSDGLAGQGTSYQDHFGDDVLQVLSNYKKRGTW